MVSENEELGFDDEVEDEFFEESDEEDDDDDEDEDFDEDDLLPLDTEACARCGHILSEEERDYERQWCFECIEEDEDDDFEDPMAFRTEISC